MAAARFVRTSERPGLRRPAREGAADRVARELGLDHARHGLTPPADALRASASLRRGHAWGRQAFAGRTRSATPAARQWLALRLQAWWQGQAFDTLTVTPHYLGQLDSGHCPVTRSVLGPEGTAVVSRLCDDAGYAAGNLAVLSLPAELAKAGRSWEDAWAEAERLQRTGTAHARSEGLDAAAWRRLAVLMSFSTVLDPVQAAQLPLLVLPPNRVHVRNPHQGLQVLATLMLARSGWSTQLNRLLSLMSHDALRQSFQRFFLALLPRVIGAGHPTDAQRRRGALEDAWREPEVLRLWQRFALQLDAPRAQALLERATALGLLRQRALLHSDEPCAAPAAAPLVRRPDTAANDPLPLHHRLASARQLSLPMGA